MANGFFLVHRRLIESDLWLSETFTRGQAWVDLVGLANYQTGFIRKRGIRIEIKRGEVGYAQDSLGERWRWSRGKVKRFLNELETDGRVVQQTTNRTTLIIIMNYESYQGDQRVDDTACNTTNGHQTDTKRTPNGTGTKKLNKINNKDPLLGKPNSSPQDIETAEYIFNKILVLNPKHKKPNMTVWANDVRLMVQQDGNSHRQIKDVFRWANENGFWKNNILSPGKLRKQWDTLLIQSAMNVSDNDLAGAI